MSNKTKNYIPKVTPEIEDSSAQIFMSFKVKWSEQEYYGTFIVTLSENFWIEEYGIEWESDEPDFGEFESYIYEQLEEKLLEEVLKKYKIR